MAKRSRAPARGLRKRPASREKNRRSPTVRSGRLSFTPDSLADIRQRYEGTDTSICEIARALGVHRTTINAIARREGWIRYQPPLRGLPPGRSAVHEAFNPELGKPSRTDGEVTLPPLADTARRLHRAILDELDTLEAVRAQMRNEWKSVGEAERTARTIARLTESLQKIQRLHPAISTPGPTDEDMPADAFRYALANRIDEFVRSRTEFGDDGGSAHPAASGAA